MNCLKCNFDLPENSKFCSKCGEKVRAEKVTNISVKYCPYCKNRIDVSNDKCPHCKRIIIERISRNEKYTSNVTDYNNQKKEGIISEFVVFFGKINYSKLIFNKYTVILIAVILFIWAGFSDDTSYNSSGSKEPLPAPIQQTSKDVDAVEFIPTAPMISLSNGTILKESRARFQGYGELYIKNGTDLDAVAKLIHGGTSVLTVYIKANSNYTMKNISDGVYWLAFAQGLDWDSVTQKFKRDVQYSSFDETFDFITTEDARYYNYQTFEVTLNPVVGGTAETSSVMPDQFNAY